MDIIRDQLNFLNKAGLKRDLMISSGIDLSSNDIHGLSNSTFIREKMVNYLNNVGSMGATGSRLVSGHHIFHQDVEAFLSNEYKPAASLLFGSGFLANLGVLTTLGSLNQELEGVEFFSDEYNHASLIDGMRLTKQKISIYRHNELEQLEHLLKVSSKQKLKVIVTESLFSMDGDSPQLKVLFSLADRYGAYLVIDEAHATGVAGLKGLGLTYDFNIDWSRTFVIHTASKALGGYGAFVLTSALNRELLINSSRSFIYSTGLSPLHTLQIKWAFEELSQNPLYLKKLHENINYLKQINHIYIIPIPGINNVLSVSNTLRENNYFVRALRYPTVPRGKERLRVTISSQYPISIYRDFEKLLCEALQRLELK